MPSPVVGLILWVIGGFHGIISTYMGNREWGKSVHINTGVIGHASNVQYSEYSPNYWCFICCSFSSFRREVTHKVLTALVCILLWKAMDTELWWSSFGCHLSFLVTKQPWTNFFLCIYGIMWATHFKYFNQPKELALGHIMHHRYFSRFQILHPSSASVKAKLNFL